MENVLNTQKTRLDTGKDNLLPKELLIDWAYGANRCKPSDIDISSSPRVWWDCHKCGFNWPATIGNRMYDHTPCPNCLKSDETQKGEELAEFFKSYFKNAYSGKMAEIPYSVIIPEVKILIDYNIYPNTENTLDYNIQKLEHSLDFNCTLINIAHYKYWDKERIMSNYTQEHTVVFIEEKSDNYSLDTVMVEIVNTLRCLGLSLKPLDSKILETKVNETPKELRIQSSKPKRTLWNDQSMEWLHTWIADESVEIAKNCVPSSMEKNITIECPNCGRRWVSSPHNIVIQFRGCTKKSGGCGNKEGIPLWFIEKGRERDRKTNHNGWVHR